MIKVFDLDFLDAEAWTRSENAFTYRGCRDAWLGVGRSGAADCLAAWIREAGARDQVSSGAGSPFPSWVFLDWADDSKVEAKGADNLADWFGLDMVGGYSANHGARYLPTEWPRAFADYVLDLQKRVERLHSEPEGRRNNGVSPDVVRARRALAAGERLRYLWRGYDKQETAMRSPIWVPLDDSNAVRDARAAYTNVASALHELHDEWLFTYENRNSLDLRRPLWGMSLAQWSEALTDPSVGASTPSYLSNRAAVDRATALTVRAMEDTWLRAGAFRHLRNNRDAAEQHRRDAATGDFLFRVLVIDDLYPLLFPMFDRMSAYEPWAFHFIRGSFADSKPDMGKALELRPIHIILLDIDLGWQGRGSLADRWLEALRDAMPEVPVLMLSRYRYIDTVAQYWEKGAAGYLSKAADAYSDLRGARRGEEFCRDAIRRSLYRANRVQQQPLYHGTQHEVTQIARSILVDTVENPSLRVLSDWGMPGWRDWEQEHSGDRFEPCDERRGKLSAPVQTESLLAELAASPAPGVDNQMRRCILREEGTSATRSAAGPDPIEIAQKVMREAARDRTFDGHVAEVGRVVTILWREDRPHIWQPLATAEDGRTSGFLLGIRMPPAFRNGSDYYRRKVWERLSDKGFVSTKVATLAPVDAGCEVFLVLLVQWGEVDRREPYTSLAERLMEFRRDLDYIVVPHFSRLSLFDIMGPRTCGPSSSHTAGACRIGRLGRRFLEDVWHRLNADERENLELRLYLHDSFRTTGAGHGSDLALLAGLLGRLPDGTTGMAGARGDFGLDLDWTDTEPEARWPQESPLPKDTVVRLLWKDAEEGSDHHPATIQIALAKREEGTAPLATLTCRSWGGGNVQVTGVGFREDRAYLTSKELDSDRTQFAGRRDIHLLRVSAPEVPMLTLTATCEPIKEGESPELVLTLEGLCDRAGTISEMARKYEEGCFGREDVYGQYAPGGEAANGEAREMAIERPLTVHGALFTMLQSILDGLCWSSKARPGCDLSELGYREKHAPNLLAAEADGSFRADMDIGLAWHAYAFSLAAQETNVRMGPIIAAPTAGACGIVPGALFAGVFKKLEGVAGLKWADLFRAYGGINTHDSGEVSRNRQQVLVNWFGRLRTEHGSIAACLDEAFLTAGMVGLILNNVVPTSGATYGCQAETGIGAAMAAAGLSAFWEPADTQAAVAAAALALKNSIGLICDPVAGRVETPCIKRSGLKAVEAVYAAAAARAGLRSDIAADEVIWVLKEAGEAMPRKFKETSRGGLAQTCAGRTCRLRKRGTPLL